MPFKTVAAAFPTFRWTARSSLSASMPPDTRESLEEEFLLEQDGEGAIHGLHHNSREFGFEFYWKKGRFHYRNRYMPLRHRAGDGTEHLRNAQRLWGVLAAYWQLLDRFCRLEYKASTAGSGRAGRGFHFKVVKRSRPLAFRGSGNAKPGGTGGGAKSWRRTLHVKEASGAVTFDRDTAVPTKVTLDAVYTFDRNGRKATVRLHYDHTLEPKEKNFAVRIPSSTPAPEKDRPELDRRALLGTIRPPGWFRGGGPVRAWKQRRRKPRIRPAGRPAIRTRRPSPATRPRPAIRRRPTIRPRPTTRPRPAIRPRRATRPRPAARP